MGWRDRAHPALVLMLLGWVLGLAGCRRLNPKFVLDTQVSPASTSAGDIVSTPDPGGGASAALSTQHDETSSQTQSTSSEEETGILASGSTSSSSSVATSSSSGSSTETLVYGEFCKDGVELCYPVFETFKTEWQSKDHGPSGNPLLLTKPAGFTPGAGTEVQPLVSTLWCKNDGFATTEKAHPFKGGAWGVDLWVAHDNWAWTEWAMVELDGVFAIRRRADGKLECAAQLTTGKEVVALDIGKPSDGLHQVTCSFQSGKLALSFDDKVRTLEITNRKATAEPANASLSVCRGQSLVQEAALRGRVAMLRLWSDVARMKRVTTFERAHLCKHVLKC